MLKPPTRKSDAVHGACLGTRAAVGEWQAKWHPHASRILNTDTCPRHSCLIDNPTTAWRYSAIHQSYMYIPTAVKLLLFIVFAGTRSFCQLGIEIQHSGWQSRSNTMPDIPQLRYFYAIVASFFGCA